ncbi:hypothetical protein BGZ65_002971 [Modicella reniformis]|uniref:Chitin synthase 4-like domain-containing protein n=1 Tax=Modicella reniformis TaxID=1440133 RepID=A0A9P6MC36_9FUNG|nr:hypothetical protein BGZ65_002971 [Modicella reniformis]
MHECLKHKNRSQESITPLIIASYNGFVAICRLLISVGHAEVNQQDNTRKSALLLASYAGHVDVMAELIERGASLDTLDQYGWSGLMLAAYAGKLEACRLLLDHSADPHIKTANGKNARSLAWDAGHKAVAVYISKFLGRGNSSPSTSGPSSSMSSRAMIQQMIPPTPRSPSRRTHSPSPSLPSVPEEGIEEANHATQRSFSGHVSTISRQSALTSRLGSRRLHPLVINPVPTKTDDDEPVSPIPTAIAPNRLVNMFNSSDEIASVESTRGEASSALASASLAGRRSIPTILPTSISTTLPTSMPTSIPLVAEKPKRRVHSSKPIVSTQIYSVHRHGIIPRYGYRHLHYQSEEQPGNQPDTEGGTPAMSSTQTPRRFRFYRRSTNSFSERTKEKDMEDSLNRRVLRGQRLSGRSRNHAWIVLSKTLTFCCPTGILPRSWSNDTRQVWREKMTLGVLLAGLSVVFGFLALGLPLLTCQPRSIHDVSISDFRADYPERLMAIRGHVYDIGTLFSDGRHPSAAGSNLTQESLNSFLNLHFGTDISFLFSPSMDLVKTCDLLGAATNFGKCLPAGSESINHCHQTQVSKDLLKDYNRNDVRIVYQWSDIQNLNALGRALFVYDGYVFDAADYLAQTVSESITQAQKTRMDWIRTLIGRDVTLTVQRRPDHKNISTCFHGYFKVGVLAGQTNGCIASIVINTLTLAILLLITVVRLASALVYRKKPSSDPAAGGDSHILMLVTCQATDTEDQIKATLDSLALADYDDNRKLLLVITDATWNSAGELSDASLSCLRLLDPSAGGSSFNEKVAQGDILEQDTDPFALDGCQPTTESIVDTTRIYSGHYIVETRRVPYVLIIRPSKARGRESLYGSWQKKRLVIQWLHRVCFNEPMTAFEFSLFEKVRELNHDGPGLFELLLITEVGSVCDQKSVGRLVNTLENNTHIMGIAGHGLVTNYMQNWLTRLQDYENHLSLQLHSALESILGVLQCLSGRFSIVRIKIKWPDACHDIDVMLSKRPSGEATSVSDTSDADDGAGVDGLKVEEMNSADHNSFRPSVYRNQREMDKIQYCVPILVHPDVVSSFVNHNTRTPHERRLVLHGGEDRYLTGLLHRAFPNRRIMSLPHATYTFTVPADLPTYLQEQRLLWISSLHNFWIQMWSSRLRGRFCCSINFLALLEWLNLVLLPTVVLLTLALVAVVVAGAVTNVGALYSLPTVLALAFILSSTILEAILGVFLRHRTIIVDLIGLALFLITLPFKYLVVTVFAFWGLDEPDSSTCSGTNDTVERSSASLPDSDRTRRHWAEWSSLRHAKNNSQGPPLPQQPDIVQYNIL